MVEWSDDAIFDLIEIIDYISIIHPTAAQELKILISSQAERLADMPYSGRIGRVDGTRERIVHPNYLIVYRITHTSIEILNILHARKSYPD